MVDPPFYENIEAKNKKKRPTLKHQQYQYYFPSLTTDIPVQILLVSKWEAKPFNQEAVPYQ